jgi:hypothetical protein
MSTVEQLFGARHFTAGELADLGERLKEKGPGSRRKAVATKATGVDWIPQLETLDARGFDVYLVNSRATPQAVAGNFCTRLRRVFSRI